jgi:hypothetical protein
MHSRCIPGGKGGNLESEHDVMVEVSEFNFGRRADSIVPVRTPLLSFPKQSASVDIDINTINRLPVTCD